MRQPGVMTMSDRPYGDRAKSKGELSYKYQRLRERLRAAVRAGEFSGKLPGERELARRFNANAKTINKALNDLALEGLVFRHVGRGTFVAGPASTMPLPSGPAKRLAWIHPVQTDANETCQQLSKCREILSVRGHRLDPVPVELDEAGELAGDNLTFRDFRQVDGVILLARPSGRLLSSLRRRRLPVVIIDNYSEAVRLPCVLADQSHAAFVLCEQCIQRGHQQIQLLISARSLPAASAAQAGYRAAMQYYGLEPLSTVQVVPEMDWTSLLEGPSRAGAMLCVSGALALQVIQETSKRGLRIPADLSIAAICRTCEACADDETFVTCYQADANRVLRWATDMALERANASTPAMVIVPGRLRDRGSVGRPWNGPVRPADPSSEARL